jgi:hypothetical protein
MASITDISAEVTSTFGIRTDTVGFSLAASLTTYVSGTVMSFATVTTAGVSSFDPIITTFMISSLTITTGADPSLGY